MRRLFLAALLLAPAVAWADPKDDARRHFAAGLKAAQEGDFEGALERFLDAQEAWPHPATLYNIGKAYTDLGDLPNAIAYYRLFRDAAPDRAADVDPILAVLEAQLGQDTAPVESPTATTGGSGAGGPTEAELARLQTIAAELQALTEALQTRAVEEAPPAPEPVTPEPIPEAPVSEAGFLEEAYERVVVTASRVGQDPLDSPSTVTVLTADDLRLSGALDVPDLLRRVVGVDVMALTAGHSDVSIRGFDRKLNNKVLVLIDGRSTYLDFIGTTFWASFPIELEEIERIEVIRGPGSAVYGANAVTGVINVITRTPGEGGQSFVVDAGAPAVGRASAVATGRTGPTAYRISAGYQQHGRWAKEADLDRYEPAGRPAPVLDGSVSPVTPFVADDDSALRILRANARVDRTLGSWGAVQVSAGLSEGQSEFFSIGALPNFGLDLRHHYIRGDFSVTPPSDGGLQGSLHLRTFWNSNAGRTGAWLEYTGARTLDADFDDDVVDVEAEVPLTFDTGELSHQLNAGAGWRYKSVRFGYLAGGFEEPYVENHFQAFLNEQATIGRLGVVGSLRVDAHPLIPISETISPRAAVLVRLFDKTSLRATAGSAYRAPTAIESYMDFALPTPADGVFVRDLGNQDLLPERITTLELGVHDESTALHLADAAVYVNRVTDLIGLSDVATAISPFDPSEVGIEVGQTGWINLAPVYTGYGVEGEIEVFPVDGLDLFANADLQQIVETTGAQSVVDGSTSTLKLNGGASYRTPFRTDLSLEAHWLSAQDWRLRTFDPDTLALVVVTEPIPAQLLLSARIGVRPVPDEDLEVAVTVWNPTGLLGDGTLQHPQGQPVGGRLFGTLAWRF